jgi:hypothetical protein
MSSYNNRLNQVIALHRRSESQKWGKAIVRGKEARAVRRVVGTPVLQLRPLRRSGETERQFRQRRNRQDAARAAKIRAAAKGAE